MRQYLGISVCEDIPSKWDKVIERILAMNSAHRPVLVGTGSVEASEELSQRLTDLAVPHQLLNARQDRTEAQIISEAGQRGRITVATNMAGRGTDIKLGPGVAELEGLHVIITEPHESRRIDRQLAGRSGRQGEPGSYEKIFSIKDPIIIKYSGSVLRRLCELLARRKDQLSQRVLINIISVIQWKSERHSAQLRRAVMLVDEQQRTALAFSGSGE
jgi:preprotein translocase subunit SecA